MLKNERKMAVANDEDMYRDIIVLGDNSAFEQATELHKIYVARFIDGNMDLAGDASDLRRKYGNE